MGNDLPGPTRQPSWIRPSGDQRPQLLRPLLYFNPASLEWVSSPPSSGFGEYPNLGVKDAFIDVRRGDRQHIVRSSGPLLDRRHLRRAVPGRGGRPLRSLRVISRSPEHRSPWTSRSPGRPPAIAGPASFIPREGQGRLRHSAPGADGHVGGHVKSRRGNHHLAEQLRGPRDRSWGVAPGSAEPESRRHRQGEPAAARDVELNYPMQFEDHSIFFICTRTTTGCGGSSSPSESASDPSRRSSSSPSRGIWHTWSPGRVLHPGSPVLTFPDAASRWSCTLLLRQLLISVGRVRIDPDCVTAMYTAQRRSPRDVLPRRGDPRPRRQYGIRGPRGPLLLDGPCGLRLIGAPGFFGPFRRYGHDRRRHGRPATELPSTGGGKMPMPTPEQCRRTP